MELYDIPLTITCDLGKNTVSPQVISINQNEANIKKLRVEFVSGGKPWEIPTGFSCNILMKKADGFAVDNPAESISGNAAVFNITPQMSVAVGENRFQIQIIKNEDDVRGFAAVLSVQRAALSNDEIISESELKTVEETIREETNKWLDDHPEATTTVQDGSISLKKFTEEARNQTVNRPASTSSAGIVQLNDTLTSSETTQAATANAVKQVNDMVSLTKDKVAAVEESVKTNSARIDAFTKLSEGSTTADAEIIDARTDYTGKTWDNLGGAIRGITKQLPLNFSGVKAMLQAQGCYLTKNLLDIKPIYSYEDSENIKYGVFRTDTNIKGLLVYAPNLNSRIVALFPAYSGTENTSITLYNSFPYIDCTDFGKVSIFFDTSVEEISECAVYGVYDKFFDLEDETYTYEQVFNPEESTVVTPDFNIEWGDLMSTGMIKVCGGNEIVVDSQYGYVAGLYVDFYYPYYNSQSDVPAYRFETKSMYPNSKGIVIPEQCGYIKILYLSKDQIQIYRKRKKTGFENYAVDFQGDSITAGFLSMTNVRPENSYVYWVNEKLNFAECVNYALSGTRITPNKGRTDSMLERTNAVLSDPDYDSKHKCFFLMGGVNDYANDVPVGDVNSPEVDVNSLEYSTITFYKSYEALIKLASEKYEGRVYVSTPLKRVAKSGTIPFDDYINAILEICDRYSVPVLRMDSESSLNVNIESVKSRYFSDGVHPSAWGQTLVMAPKVTKFFENNVFNALVYTPSEE